jgi:hypothetical protein
MNTKLVYVIQKSHENLSESENIIAGKIDFSKFFTKV